MDYLKLEEGDKHGPLIVTGVDWTVVRHRHPSLLRYCKVYK
jgi:hypothetical protein